MTPELPQKSLISKQICLQIFGQSVIQAAYQAGIYIAAVNMSWFHEQTKNSQYNTKTDESTVVFLASLPIHVFPIILIELFTPFRKRIFNNYILLFIVISQLLIVYWVVLLPLGFMKSLFRLRNIDKWFAGCLIGGSFICFLMMLIFELILIRVYGRTEKLEVTQKTKDKYD